MADRPTDPVERVRDKNAFEEALAASELLRARLERLRELPKELWREVEAGDARVAEFEDFLNLLDSALDDLRQEMAEGKRELIARLPDHEFKLCGYGEIIADKLRRLREDADWTQAKLAEAMTQYGFEWKRITVAEVERATRRVSLEELVTLAEIYGEPLVQVLLPRDNEHLNLPNRVLSPDELRTLILGGDSVTRDGGTGDSERGSVAGRAGDSFAKLLSERRRALRQKPKPS